MNRLRKAIRTWRCGLFSRRLLGSLDAGEDLGRGHAQGPAEADERVHGRGFVVVFEQAEVGTVDLGRDRDLLLGHVGGFSRPPQLISECHEGSVKLQPSRVCLLLQTEFP
jgi:hypothetical protein